MAKKHHKMDRSLYESELLRLQAELVLGIESTCDETGAALVRGRELLGDVVATSMDAYARFGGIIPEIASRATWSPSCPPSTRPWIARAWIWTTSTSSP